MNYIQTFTYIRLLFGVNCIFWPGPALGGAEPNWEHVYCNVLCVLDELRVDYTLVWGPLRHGTQLRTFGPIGLRLALLLAN